jgi:hypothetical protein
VNFDKAVGELREEVKKFQKSAKEKLDTTIKKNCDDVIARLLPAVRLKMPTRWQATLGNNPSDDLIRRRLEKELKSAYGMADAYLDRIEIRLIYKDITIEMLRDEEFEKAAEKAGLFLATMYEEYQAARARD